MRLHKLLHRDTETREETIRTHIVNEVQMQGEYTLCGLDIYESDIATNDFEAYEDEYEGSWKSSDCSECIGIVQMCKSAR